MSDRRVGEPPHTRTTRRRGRLRARLAWRLVALGLAGGGSALMGFATLGEPAASAAMTLAGDETLAPLPVGNGCTVTVPVIVTTVHLPNLSILTTCSSTQTTSLAVGSAPSGAVTADSVSSTSPSSTSPSGVSRVSSTTARPNSASTTSSTQSKTAAGVLGADAGTPSTGTDIAFGIGIGLVIAGAGIGSGTGAFLRRRRTTP